MTKNDKKVSVLVTFYNQSKYVDQALSSIVQQKVDFNYEILVGDDGSSDGTLEKIKTWQQKYPALIKYFVMDRDHNTKGHPIHRASANRINLITKSQGEYFTVLDGDDFYCDDTKLAKQVEILDAKENRDCIGCAHGMNTQNEDTGVFQVKKSRINEGKITPFYYWGRNFHFSSCCFLFRNIFRNNFHSNYPVRYFNDSTLTLYMLNYGNIYYIPNRMVTICLNSGSIWYPSEEIYKKITSLIIYETAKNTNRELEKASLLRYFRTIKYVYKHRKSYIDPCYEELRKQAADENAKDALRWLEYPYQNFYQKCKNPYS